jgi:AMMECR1 domain-containing protein
MIVHGERRGVLLPQVAAERGWSRQEFLENLCHKAGLSPDCLSQQPKLYGFTTVAFEEE